MVSSNKIEDYPLLTSPDTWRISPTNTEYVSTYILRKRVKGIKLTTVYNNVYKILQWLRNISQDDIRTAGSDLIQAYYLQRLETCKITTTTIELTIFRDFLKTLFGIEHCNSVLPIKPKQYHNTLESTAYINQQQVRQLRDYVESTGDLRGVAIIMMLFGTGVRISELLDAKVKDVEIKLQSAVLTVSGKTGTRKIPFVVGLPELQNWLNIHPVRVNGKVSPDAPLFVTYATRGNAVVKLSVDRVEHWLKKQSRNAGIPDTVKCNPHAFRHLYASSVAHKLTAREMNRLFGWSDSCNTALTYIHTSQQELEDTVLSLNGITPEKEQKIDEWVVQCPACKSILPSSARWCPKCRLILDPVLAVQVGNISMDLGDKEILHQYLDD